MIPLLLLAALAVPVAGRPTNSIDRWHTLSNVCGKLVRDESFPVKSNPPFYQERFTGIGKVGIQLFSWQENLPCCSASPIAGTRTERSGEFRFKKITPGSYWLVFHVSGHKYVVGIAYDPNRNKDDSCSDHIFTIEKSGEFTLMRTVHVD